jgi:hypothetical protein
MANKAKRVSKVVHVCSKHGKFVGYKWSGHRRHCQAKEVLPKGQKPAKAAKRPARKSRPVKAVRVRDNAIPMADSVTLLPRNKAKTRLESVIPSNVGPHLGQTLLEIGVSGAEFFKYFRSEKAAVPSIHVEIRSLAKGHRTPLPFAVGDFITEVNDTAFTTTEYFLTLIDNAVKRKQGSVWITFRRNGNLSMRRAVTLRSWSTAQNSTFIPSKDIVVRIENRLVSLDKAISDARQYAEGVASQASDLAKKLDAVRDDVKRGDLKVTELEEARKDFLKRLETISK